MAGADCFSLAIDRIRKPHEDELGELETAGSEPDAERVAIHREQVAMVQRLIAALPDELRQALLLSAVEELNSRQIAEVLGASEAAVRGRIFRARQILKEKLAALTDKQL